MINFPSSKVELNFYFYLGVMLIIDRGMNFSSKILTSSNEDTHDSLLFATELLFRLWRNLYLKHLRNICKRDFLWCLFNHAESQSEIAGGWMAAISAALAAAAAAVRLAADERRIPRWQNSQLWSVSFHKEDIFFAPGKTDQPSVNEWQITKNAITIHVKVNCEMIPPSLRIVLY